MADSVAPGTWMQHLDDVLPRLKEKGTLISTGEKLAEIYADRIVTVNVKTNARKNYYVNKVVLALGSGSNRELADEVKKAGIKTLVIGDNSKVGRIANATSTAYEAAISL